MAREMTKKTRRFSLEESDAIEENERILESGSQQRKENRENKGSGEVAASAAPAPSAETSTTEKPTTSATTTSEPPTPTTPVADQPATTSFSNDIVTSMRKPKGKKTENGITIYVPMEYYERIALMKMRTGVPIKDLALQAVIEFLDRNKM